MDLHLPLIYYLHPLRLLGKLVQSLFGSICVAVFFSYVAGTFFNRFTILDISKLFLFLMAFISLVVYFVIKDFQYWPRKFIMERDLIQVTSLLGKSITINREDVAVFKFDRRQLVIGTTQKQIHLTNKPWADHEQILLSSTLIKWVPNHALPIEMDEVVTWLDTHPVELAKYLHNSITLETSSREIKNLRGTAVFMFLIVASLIAAVMWVRPNVGIQEVLPLAVILIITGLYVVIVWYASRPMFLSVDERGIFAQKGKKITEWYWEDVEVVLLYWQSSNRHLEQWREGKKQSINLMLFDKTDYETIANVLFEQTLAHGIPFSIL